jgi:hypothetical protein
VTNGRIRAAHQAQADAGYRSHDGVQPGVFVQLQPRLQPQLIMEPASKHED